MLDKLCEDPQRAETYFKTQAVNNSLLSQTFNPMD